MAIVSKIIEPVRGVGRERAALLGALTGGHTAIHWFQQIFPLIVPQVTIALGLSPFQVGVMGAARQVGNLMTLPSGLLADSWVKHRAIMLGAALVFMGIAYLLIGVAPSFIWVLPGAMFVGLGTAAWHPPAMASLSSRFPEKRATVLSIHGVGATFGDTFTPLAVSALFLVFAWQRVMQLQVLVGIVAALIIWRTLAHQFTDAGPRPSRGDQFRDVPMAFAVQDEENTEDRVTELEAELSRVEEELRDLRTLVERRFETTTSRFSDVWIDLSRIKGQVPEMVTKIRWLREAAEDAITLLAPQTIKPADTWAWLVPPGIACNRIRRRLVEINPLGAKALFGDRIDQVMSAGLIETAPERKRWGERSR